jgi:hypothetical protein
LDLRGFEENDFMDGIQTCLRACTSELKKAIRGERKEERDE